MALIRLRGCAGWSATFVVRKPLMIVFSCRGPMYDVLQSLNIVFILANSANPGEMSQFWPFSWVLTGCQSTLLVFPVYKGLSTSRNILSERNVQCERPPFNWFRLV